MAYMIWRRTLRGATFITLAGVAVVAAAQPAPGPNPTPGPGPGMMGNGPGPGMMGGGGMRGGGPGMMGGFWNTASYLDSLKTELGITEQQKPAWEDYSNAVTDAGNKMQGLHQEMFDAMGTASWQERRDMMNRMFQARQQVFDTVHEAANKLMPTLTQGQQAKARQTLPGLAYGRGMMGQR